MKTDRALDISKSFLVGSALAYNDSLDTRRIRNVAFLMLFDNNFHAVNLQHRAKCVTAIPRVEPAHPSSTTGRVVPEGPWAQHSPKPRQSRGHRERRLAAQR
jgi:hypothetical protein